MSAEVGIPAPEALPAPVKKRGLFGDGPAANGRQQKKSGKQRKNDILSRRNRWYRRLFRFVRVIGPWVLLFSIAYWAYTDEVVLGVIVATFRLMFQLAFAIVFIVVEFGAMFWFMSRSKVEKILPEDPKAITFDDYWGQPNLKRLVRQWISLLSDRDDFVKMGGQYINGLLLYGEPGTGKTMLAKAMAGEAGVAFISMEGSGFRGMFWGMDVLKMIWFVGKARKLAREYGACIAYIDEIDAVGMSRGGVMGGQTGMGMGMGGMMGMGGTGALTRLLYEMDGVGEKTRSEKLKARLYQLLGKKAPLRKWHVLFMGSTNRPDVLDPALTRPGRFDQMIHVAPPDKRGRREIITGYLSKIKTDGSIDIEALISDTTNTTPAQIMSAITKDAVRIALFDGRHAVTHADIDKAFQEQVVGIENPVEEMDPEQRRQIAYHESGHAVVQHYAMPDQRIVYVSIVRRARGVLGYMLPADKVEVYAQPLRRIVADILVSMAGHVATKIFFGEYWTGASGDNQNIRAQIRHLASLGYFGPPIKEMIPGLGGGDYLMGGEQREVERFWKIMEEKVEDILYQHYYEVDAIAKALLEKNNLASTEVLDLLGVNSLGVGNPNVKATALRDRAEVLSPNGHELQEAVESIGLPEPAPVSEPVEVEVPEPVSGD
jgi:cell division protease FtsH